MARDGWWKGGFVGGAWGGFVTSGIWTPCRRISCSSVLCRRSAPRASDCGSAALGEVPNTALDEAPKPVPGDDVDVLGTAVDVCGLLCALAGAVADEGDEGGSDGGGSGGAEGTPAIERGRASSRAPPPPPAPPPPAEPEDSVAVSSAGGEPSELADGAPFRYEASREPLGGLTCE